MSELVGAIPKHLLRDTDTLGTPEKKGTMGKDDFMKLLLTQIQHQDPLKPMDHQEFSAQLAQFSQLEQLSNIGAGIKDLKTGMSEESKLQAMGMIGKRIEASGNELYLMEGQGAGLPHSLGPDVKPVKAEIFDGSGTLVREMELKNEVGSAIRWDGKTDRGDNAPAGKYSFRVHGVGKDGKPEVSESQLGGKVTGVELTGSTPMLLVQTKGGPSKVEMSKVRNVSIDNEPSAVKAPAAPTVEKPKVVAAAESVPAEEEDEEIPGRSHGELPFFTSIGGYRP